MSDTHPMRELLDTLEAALAAAGDPSAAGMSGLSNGELEDIATRGWALVQRAQGMVVVPAVAEADHRRLFETREYGSASSMRDLFSAWLHCDSTVAGKPLKVGKGCVNGPYRATGDALASGDIDVDHATKIIGAIRRLSSAVVDSAQRREAESTMLEIARDTDPHVTNAAGYRLLELVAPDEAADYIDRKAERERLLRAEEARGLEITSTPIAGCRELRLRLETATMNTLARLIESLTRHGDNERNDLQTEQALALLPAGAGEPGDVAAPNAGIVPIERRRADAMAELVSAMAQPHLADELDPTHPRKLADELDTNRTTTVDARLGTAGDAEEGRLAEALDAGGQIVLDTCPDQQESPPPPRQQTHDRRNRRGECPSSSVLTNYDHARRQFRAGEACGPGARTMALSVVDVETIACEATVTPVWMTDNQTPVSVKVDPHTGWVDGAARGRQTPRIHHALLDRPRQNASAARTAPAAAPDSRMRGGQARVRGGAVLPVESAISAGRRAC